MYRNAVVRCILQHPYPHLGAAFPARLPERCGWSYPHYGTLCGVVFGDRKVAATGEAAGNFAHVQYPGTDRH